MFNGCKSLSSLSDLKDWNVGKVNNMSGMFADCKKLTSAEKLSNWATKVGNVTNMSSLFSGCELLNSISDLKDWNVGNVTDMNNMFSWCKSLSSLSDLKGWKVNNVTDMHNMFEECIGLSNLSGLENWKVDNVKNMRDMFSHSFVEGTDKLTDISALSKWNVSNVENMSGMFSDCKSLTGTADLSKWDISKVTDLSSMFSNAGAESGNNFVLDFSNKTFTKSDTPVYTDDEGKQYYFSVKDMFNGFKGTLIANNLKSEKFTEGWDDDDPIAAHFASGEIFSKTTVNDDDDYSSSIVITDNYDIVNAHLSKYYIPVKAKLMEPGDMDSCKCDGSGDSGGTTYTYYVPALYSSKEKSSGNEEEGEEPNSILRAEGESLQDYAYKIVKSSFASNLRSAIDDSQASEDTGGGASEEQPSEEQPDSGSRSAKFKSRVKRLRSIKKSRVKELRSARKSRAVRDGDGEGSEEEEVPESPEEEQGSTYKIMFKSPSGSGDSCTWTELGDSDGAVPVSDPISPLVFFTTTYYLETFVRPVPLPHTGGQSAVMFTFLSIGLFSMFAVSGAFGRHGWVASVLPSTALAGFTKVFSGGTLDVASGAKHCFAHSVAHSVVSGSMLKTDVSAATGFFAWFRGDGSTFCKHAKQL